MCTQTHLPSQAQKKEKNVKIQYCILCILYKPLADAGPKDGKRLIAVLLRKQEFRYLWKTLEWSKTLGGDFHLPCFTSIFLTYTLSLMLGYSQLLMWRA